MRANVHNVGKNVSKNFRKIEIFPDEEYFSYLTLPIPETLLLPKMMPLVSPTMRIKDVLKLKVKGNIEGRLLQQIIFITHK